MERAVVVPIAAPPTKLHSNVAHPPYQCNCNASKKNHQSTNLLLGNQCSTLDKNSEKIPARMPPPNSSIPPAAQCKTCTIIDAVGALCDEHTFGLATRGGARWVAPSTLRVSNRQNPCIGSYEHVVQSHRSSSCLATKIGLQFCRKPWRLDISF